jgi:hypothetical protein
MVEVQKHGFSFEEWVRNTFFDGYEGTYMQKWDIPPDRNDHHLIPENLQGVPVSVKSAKYGSPIGLGDIIRQRSINHPFLMIAGFWKQRTEKEKWFEEIEAVLFTPETWESLWGSLTLEKITPTDSRIKDLNMHYTEARTIAREWKRLEVAPSKSTIVVNPKIDSKKQRRIQCSLPFNTFWHFANRAPKPSDSASLFGVEFLNPVISGARTFNRS